IPITGPHNPGSQIISPARRRAPRRPASPHPAQPRTVPVRPERQRMLRHHRPAGDLQQDNVTPRHACHSGDTPPTPPLPSSPPLRCPPPGVPSRPPPQPDPGPGSDGALLDHRAGRARAGARGLRSVDHQRAGERRAGRSAAPSPPGPPALRRGPGFSLARRVLDRGTDPETSYVPVPSVVNKLFTAFLKAEAKLHDAVSLPAGSSLITILRKTDAASHQRK